MRPPFNFLHNIQHMEHHHYHCHTTVLDRTFCRISLLVAVSIIWATSTVFAQEKTEYIPRTVIVQFDTDVAVYKTGSTSLQEFDRKASRHKVYQMERAFPFLDHVVPTAKTRRNLLALRRTYFVRYHADTSPEQVADELNRVPDVIYSEPAVKYHMHVVEPNDPDFSTQDALQELRLPEAWDIVQSENGTPKVVIAIIDSGSEWDHEDLHANVWANEDEIPDNGMDDDGNGFVDDTHGVNFPNQKSNDPKSLLGDAHGTAVAGTASAVTDNGVGIAGAAWNAEIMHVNVACAPELEPGICHGEQGIIYAAANGADIINVSWGSRSALPAYSRLLEESLELATDMGSLVVAAAGNENMSYDRFRFMPGRHPRVLSVGATRTGTRTLAGFSNYGTLVNVYAPGTSILTTMTNNSYMSVEGTSFSAPLVAGVAALVKTKHPDWTPDMIREHIRLTGENMDADNPELAGELRSGYVNALAAVQTMPSSPAIRLKRWDWTDDDGDRQILPGDNVTITAVFVNYLADAQQFHVELEQADTYPFLNWNTHEKEVGILAGGSSVSVEFNFSVDADLDEHRVVRLFTQIRDGDFEDRADIIVLPINSQYQALHQNLSALYRETNGDAWTKKNNWDLSTVPSVSEFAGWYGVSFKEGGIFSGLFLEQNNLTGSLPAEIGNLSSMESLHLSKNQISGEIPAEIKNLTNLMQLDLSHNLLSERIPSGIGDLSLMQYLSLRDNSLSETIPPELGNLTNLFILYLDGNSLSGEIPSTLGNFSNLIELNLEQNALLGEIPPELGNLFTLNSLRLSNNALSGEIPPELGKLVNLETLILTENKLSGDIPSELWELSNLKVLFLDRNELSGELPTELQNFLHLTNIDLTHNTLSGTIPPEVGTLSGLYTFAVGHNSLSGQIPPELGNLSSLISLFLNNNSLSGEIPSELGNLSTLRSLHLSGNDLSGEIPTNLANLAELEDLQLENNSLSGEIPPELGSLSNLQYLHIESNRLTGELPRNFLQLRNLVRFHFEGQLLCAPADDEFQTWLNSIEFVRGATCSSLSFATTIANQSYLFAKPITTLVLPVATGGSSIIYTLSPDLPQGLTFTPATRTIHGTPTEPLPPTSFTYTATDADGNTAAMTFRIEVVLPVSKHSEILPGELIVHANYPNPFRQATRMVFDLPWPARVHIEVMDILGRHVYTAPSVDLGAGWGHEVELNGMMLPAGHYLYRLIASAPDNHSVHVGQFVRTR